MKTYLRLPAFELKMVRCRSVRYEPTICDGGQGAARILHAALDTSDRERVLVLAMNARNEVLGINEAAVGGGSFCALDPRNVWKFALLANASGLILGHNHPSNDPSPSHDDVTLTRSIYDGALLLGLRLQDHVIVCQNGSYHSMYEHGEGPFGAR